MKIAVRDLRKRFNISDSDKVLDVGGSSRQLTEVAVDTLVDLEKPQYFEYNRGQRLLARHFVRLDLGKDSFPFKDKAFDFVFCGHTLEDLYDPRLAILEMGRVAKRGFFVTPSRGREMEYTKFDVTDWLTGGTRLPGHAHHHWFFENKNDCLHIVPKHYPLLYSPEFQIVKWTGPQECEYYWDNFPKTKFFDDINFRHLLADYRNFVKENINYLRFGKTHIWLDNPITYAAAYWKKIKHIGNAYVLK